MTAESNHEKPENLEKIIHKSELLLPSSEALNQICDENHPKYGRSSLNDMGKGAVCLAVSAVPGYWPYKFLANLDAVMHNAKFQNWGENLILGGSMFVAGAFAAGVVVVGSYFIKQGVSRMLLRGKGSNDGTVYRIDDGFTNKPTKYDKKEGAQVTPIDSIEELQDVPSDNYVLINGVRVLDKEFYESSDNFTTIVRGELNNKPLRVFYTGSDGDYARHMASKELGSSVCVVGRLTKEKHINASLMFSDARMKPKNDAESLGSQN